MHVVGVAYGCGMLIYCSLDAVELLLSDGSPIDKGVELSNATPLHYAVQGGHDGCVQLLLDWGAKVNSLLLHEVQIL